MSRRPVASTRQAAATLLLVTTVLALATCALVANRNRLALEDEHSDLKRVIDDLSFPVAKPKPAPQLAERKPVPSLSDEEHRELLRLRGEVALLRQQAGEVEKLRTRNQQARAALESAPHGSPRSGAAAKTADYWPRDSWAFAGFGTPADALQTSLWAANNGDLKTLAASVTGELEKILTGDLGGKSETEAAIKAMDEVSRWNSVRVVSRETVDASTAVLTVAFEDKTTTETHTDKMLMKLVDNTWKIAGPPSRQ